MNKEKLNNWKKKLSDNAGEITFWSLISVTTVGYIALVAYSVKKSEDTLNQEMQRAHELRLAQESLKGEALARGAMVLPNGDNGFWVMEDDGRIVMI